MGIRDIPPLFWNFPHIIPFFCFLGRSFPLLSSERKYLQVFKFITYYLPPIVKHILAPQNDFGMPWGTVENQTFYFELINLNISCFFFFIEVFLLFLVSEKASFPPLRYGIQGADLIQRSSKQLRFISISTNSNEMH